MSNPSCYYVELGPDSLQGLGGDAGLELPLERQADGRLTAACRERVALRLQGWLRHSPWQPRPRIFCALGARGISLRRLTLPSAAKDELTRLLLLQIESEFPLPPAELAWGYRKIGATPRPNGANGSQELLVAALKRETLQDAAGLFAQCGASPVFVLAAVARSHLCPRPPSAYAILDLRERTAEWAAFDDGVPSTVRVFPWGAKDLAAELRGAATPPGQGSGQPDDQPETSGETALAALARCLEGQTASRKLYLTCNLPAGAEIAAQLAQALRGLADGEVVKLTPGEGRSAAILGLRQAIEREGLWPAPVLELKPVNGRRTTLPPSPRKWAALAAALAIGALLMPYAEALLLKPRLAKSLAGLEAEKLKLATVDRELEFLQYLKQNQPPYFDTIYFLAKSAPPGARFDMLTMSRRGEFSLRGSLKDAQQIADFRAKLVDSGCFTNAAVEEQSPGRQKLNLRMTAQWKAAGAPEALAAALAREPEKTKPGGKGPPAAAGAAAAASPVPQLPASDSVAPKSAPRAASPDSQPREPGATPVSAPETRHS